MSGFAWNGSAYSVWIFTFRFGWVDAANRFCTGWPCVLILNPKDFCGNDSYNCNTTNDEKGWQGYCDCLTFFAKYHIFNPWINYKLSSIQELCMNAVKGKVLGLTWMHCKIKKLGRKNPYDFCNAADTKFDMDFGSWFFIIIQENLIYLFWYICMLLFCSISLHRSGLHNEIYNVNSIKCYKTAKTNSVHQIKSPPE